LPWSTGDRVYNAWPVAALTQAVKLRYQLEVSLPRYAMHKRSLCRQAVSVFPSVCLSVTFVDSVEANKHIFKTFSPAGSHTILALPYQTSWQYSDRTPLTESPNADWVGENRRSERIARYRSMTAVVRDQQLTVVGAVVYNSHGARLFTAHIATHQRIRRREENRTEFICTQR